MSTDLTEEVVALQMNDNGWQEDPHDYKLAKIGREVRVLRSLVLLLAFIAVILLAINVWVLCFKDASSTNYFLPRNGGATFHAQKSNDARDEFQNINSTCYKELQKIQTVFTAKLADSADELRDVIRKMNTTLTEKVQTVSKMPGPPGPKGECTGCLPSGPRGGKE